jgi:CRP-like cAMP-binding protein
MKYTPYCEICGIRTQAYFKILGKKDMMMLRYEKNCSVYRKNQVIFTEENRANGVFCLHNGKVKISKTGYEGREQIMRFITPGELFGLRSIIDANVYSVNATAIEESRICFIPQSIFCDLTTRYPSILKRLVLALCNRLLDAENKMTSLAQKPVRERLAETLLYLGERFQEDKKILGIELKNKNVINLSREDLSNIIGSATETVIRLLSDFKEENLISVKGRRIIIQNQKKLEQIANLGF